MRRSMLSMGYYADGSGLIKYKKPLNGHEISEVYKKLGDVFETDYDANESRTVFYISSSGKYYEEDVIDTLRSVAEIAKIDEGEIEYVGEDYGMWRFIYKDDEWEEQEGRVVYA